MFHTDGFDRRSMQTANRGSALDELSSIQQELNRLRQRDTRPELSRNEISPRSTNPIDHAGREAVGRRGLSGSRFADYYHNDAHTVCRSTFEEDVQSFQSDEGTGGECADVREQQRAKGEEKFATGNFHNKASLEIDLIQLQRDLASLESERRRFEEQQLEHRQRVLQTDVDLQAERRSLDQARRELAQERQDLENAKAKMGMNDVQDSQSNAILARVQRLVEEEQRIIRQERAALDAERRELAAERNRLNELKHDLEAHSAAKAHHPKDNLLWDAVTLSDLKLQLAVEQAQLDLDRAKLKEGQMQLSLEQARVEEDVAELCHTRSTLQNQMEQMERSFATLYKQQQEVNRAMDTIDAEWKEVEHAREQVKDLLADAAQRIIPILEKLEQMRKEDYFRNPQSSRAQRPKGSNYYEGSGGLNQVPWDVGSSRDGSGSERGIFNNFDVYTRRRSTLEIYRQRAMENPSRAPAAHGLKVSNWDDFRHLRLLLGHLSMAKFEFAQVDTHGCGRISGKALAQWILDCDPPTMRNLIPGQLKLMFQSVDARNVGYIDFWGFLAIQLFVCLDLHHFNMFEWIAFVSALSHPKHEPFLDELW